MKTSGNPSLTNVVLFDTLSREARPLEVSDGVALRYYCCGPTVYGPAHIGNFRSFVLQDVLRRVVESAGVAVRHVRNLTDVDDKTIRGARASGRPLSSFTSEWTEKFRRDGGRLGLLAPHVEASAVASIPLQIELIERLVAGGHAYAAGDGSVYFRVGSFGRYGALSRLGERELRIGAAAGGRQSDDEYGKDAASDFALWKAWRAEDGENFWESPWGRGRPGWHTECAAMSLHHLGAGFDLHAGGMDLVFPHHENEIAQAECVCGGRRFARHWFHIAHLLVDGAKMSKSLGNLFTLDDVEARGYSPLALRYLLLSGHYRQPLNFTWESLDAAASAVGRLGRLQALLAAAAARGDAAGDGGAAADETFEPVLAALRADLHTAKALGALFSAAREIETAGEAVERPRGKLAGLRKALTALGLERVGDEAGGAPDAGVPGEVRELAAARWQAKSARDWRRADELRERIRAAGWEVKDAKDDYELAPRN